MNSGDFETPSTAKTGPLLHQLQAQNEELRRTQAELEAALEALNESEARNRAMLNTLPDLMFVQRRDGTYLDFRAADENALFIPPEQFLGKKTQDVFPPRFAAVFLQVIERAVVTGTMQICEYSLPMGGDTRWFEARVVPYGDDKVLSIIREISERKRAEVQREAALEALRESEERYRSLFDGVPIGLYRTTPAGAIIDANQAMVEMLGYPDREALLLTNVLNWHADPEERSRWQRLLESRSIVRGYKVQLLRLDGTSIWARDTARLVRDGHNQVAYYEGSLENISEYEKVQEALREGEALMQSIFRAAPIGIGLVSNRVLLAANDRLCEMTGYAREELLGQSARLLYPSDEDFEYVGRVKYKQIEERGIGTVETRFKRQDGRLIDVLLSSAPLDPANLPGGVSFTVLDITERKRADAERDRLQTQLSQAQKMESVGRLAGGVAHDFNNMLSVIIGHADLALRQTHPAALLYADLEEIRQAAQRSADLTRQLLAFARKQIVAPRVVDLNDTIARMLNMLRRLIGETIELAWMPGAELWPIKIDPAQIDQILINLCLNARDAIGQAGRITIKTENINCERPDCASFASPAPGAYVMLTVSDDGCGMDRESLEHLFEPFFTTKAVGMGTGLGLATVYGIVKQNHGCISVTSEPMQGAIFKICLPRSTGETAAAEVQVQSAATGQGTVLLVEDEAAILRLGKAVLEQLGYTTLAASVPSDALRQAEAHPGEIDLLITDMVMPEMNGRDLAARIKTLNPGMKCLFMSGYAADMIADHGVLDEGIWFLQKPFSVDELAVKARQVLDSKA